MDRPQPPLLGTYPSHIRPVFPASCCRSRTLLVVLGFKRQNRDWANRRMARNVRALGWRGCVVESLCGHESAQLIVYRQAP